MLNNARTLNDLRIPPANPLEALKGERRGQHSIRINDQWRICFTWRAADELIEAITHLAFYAGWPNAVTAISVAKDVFKRNPQQ
jgi:hypothetical protein